MGALGLYAITVLSGSTVTGVASSTAFQNNPLPAFLLALFKQKAVENTIVNIYEKGNKKEKRNFKQSQISSSATRKFSSSYK
jgi:hypothetical protein